MMKRMIAGTVLMVFVATPVSAQFAVIDPANLAQAILIVQRTQRQYEELQRAVPDDSSHGAGARAHGPVPHAAIRAEQSRHRAVDLRPAMDRRPQRRRCDRSRVPGDVRSRSVLQTCRRRVRSGSTHVRAPIRDGRDHRFGSHDGRPPGRPDARLLRPTAGGRAGARAGCAEQLARRTTR